VRAAGRGRQRLWVAIASGAVAAAMWPSIGTAGALARGSAGPAGHWQGSGASLSLAQAPLGLQAAVARALSRSPAPGAPSQQARLTAFDAATGDYFGFSVALYSDTAVVGARNKTSHTGAAYVFVRSGTTWTQQAELAASDASIGDMFGWSVALAGPTVVVGAPYKNGSVGAAYVFVHSGTTWRQQVKLTASDGGAGDRFGYSVALAGSTAAVGAAAWNSATGATYVFVRSGGAWFPQAKLTASDGGSGDQFGYSVALSGSTAVVGAPGWTSGTGSAYVFVRSGTTWSQQAQLAASDAIGGDNFGWSVAVYGGTAMVGAASKSASTGAAYVFVRSRSGWSEQAELVASDATAGDYFGAAVALYKSTAMVGPPGKASFSGATYTFVRSGTIWSQQAELTGSDTATGDRFGRSVALTGSTAVVGAWGNSSSTGAAYVFILS
jgi:hypothetical protein